MFLVHSGLGEHLAVYGREVITNRSIANYTNVSPGALVSSYCIGEMSSSMHGLFAQKAYLRSLHAYMYNVIMRALGCVYMSTWLSDPAEGLAACSANGFPAVTVKQHVQHVNCSATLQRF